MAGLSGCPPRMPRRLTTRASVQSASAAIDALANAGIMRGLPYMGYLKNAPSAWGRLPQLRQQPARHPAILSAHRRVGTVSVPTVTTTLCRGLLDALKPDNTDRRARERRGRLGR